MAHLLLTYQTRIRTTAVASAFAAAVTAANSGLPGTESALALGYAP